MKITALTSCCVDLYPDLDKVYVGGNSLNFATQCKHSGIDDVSIVGAVGKDNSGELILQHLDACGIERSHLHGVDEPTASNRIFINRNGDRYFKEDSWNGGAFDTFRLFEKDWELLEERDIIAMPAGDPNLQQLLERRREQLVVIDFLDYFKLDYIEKLIESIDISFISAGEEMLDDLNQLSTKAGKLVVATLGSKGSVAFHNNTAHFQEALAVDEIIDTTGCGDAFQAAFAIAWYKTGNIPESLRDGALAAKKVLGFMGGANQAEDENSID